MLNLTYEQVEKAVEAYYKAGPTGPSWETLPSPTKYRIGEQLRAAAPFLQAPWEMPTEKDMVAFVGGVVRKELPGGEHFDWTPALTQFVACRNAALLPRPVDPRRERIINALSVGCGNVDLTADRILAALDGKGGAR